MIISHETFDLLDKIVLERMVFKPPIKNNSTMHDEACFIHVLHGNSRLYFPKNHVNLKTSDSIVMQCGSYLNKWFKNEDDQANEAVAVHLYPDVLREVYEDQMPDILVAKNQQVHNPVEKIQVNHLIDNYVKSLIFYFENPSLVSEELIKIKVKEIILLLANTDKSNQVMTILGDLFHPIQYKFKEIVNAHLYEDLSIQDLAILTGNSLSSFKRKFKSIFNTSPVQYIKRRRLEKAQTLLTTTNLRISDIAYDCGFNDLSYFSKTFHASFQRSPSDFRKMQLS